MDEGAEWQKPSDHEDEEDDDEWQPKAASGKARRIEITEVEKAVDEKALRSGFYIVDGERSLGLLWGNGDIGLSGGFAVEGNNLKAHEVIVRLGARLGAMLEAHYKNDGGEFLLRVPAKVWAEKGRQEGNAMSLPLGLAVSETRRNLSLTNNGRNLEKMAETLGMKADVLADTKQRGLMEFL
jgi:hypothetical protein